MRTQFVLWVCCTLKLLTHVVFPIDAYAQAEITLKVQATSNVFGGSTVNVRVTVNSKPFNGRVSWVHSRNGRTLSNGDIREPDGQGNFSFEVSIPETETEVAIKTQLEIATVVGGRSIGSTIHPIWILPKRPFATRSQWLKSLDLQLFDADGKTAETLTEAGIPFSRLRKTSDLEGLSNAVILIGEGVSFEKHRTLADELFKAAARGNRVVCFAPSRGRIDLPSDSDDLQQPQQLKLLNQEAITSLDERLDSRIWGSTINPTVSRLKLRASRSRVQLEVTDQPVGWLWMESKYDNGGVLIVCGYGVIKHWNAGATPRHLLLSLLQSLTPTK